MSHEHEVMWKLEQERKERLRRERAGSYVEEALKRFNEQYQTFLDQDYDAYIPAEMSQIKDAINQISTMAADDPIGAQRICYELNHTVNNMNYYVHSAIAEIERKERAIYQEIQRQQQESKSALEKFYFSKISEIKNPVVINFCMDEIKQIKEKIQKEEIKNETEISELFENLNSVSKKRYEEWKTKKLEDDKITLLKENVQKCIDEIENQKFENTERKQAIINELTELSNSISLESVESEVAAKILEIRNKSDDALISEASRREMVMIIIKELKSQEFIVDKPKIFGEGKNSYVVISAKKPSGKQAVCKINLEGKLNYRFDHYEGMTCLKDIEKFGKDLQDIYNINFSDDRVLWENPDRLSRTQSMASDSNKRNM